MATSDSDDQKVTAEPSSEGRDVEAKIAARPGRRVSAIEWREPGRRRAFASSSHCAREGVERAVDDRAAVQTSTLQSGQLREIKSTYRLSTVKHREDYPSLCVSCIDTRDLLRASFL